MTKHFSFQPKSNTIFRHLIITITTLVTTKCACVEIQITIETIIYVIFLNQIKN